MSAVPPVTFRPLTGAPFNGQPCPLCGSPVWLVRKLEGDGVGFSCNKCGRYGYSTKTLATAVASNQVAKPEVWPPAWLWKWHAQRQFSDGVLRPAVAQVVDAVNRAAGS